MHNIARNCNLQLLDGLVYLEGKEKEERQEGNRMYACSDDVLYVKNKMLTRFTSCHFNTVSSVVSVLNPIS